VGVWGCASAASFYKCGSVLNTLVQKWIGSAYDRSTLGKLHASVEGSPGAVVGAGSGTRHTMRGASRGDQQMLARRGPGPQ
jgi:hypothetical protein